MKTTRISAFFIVLLCLLFTGSVATKASVEDVTGPVLLDITLDENGETLVVGNTLHLSFKAVDESLISKIHLQFDNHAMDTNFGYVFFEAQISDASLTYNSVTEKYEAIFTIPTSTKNGEWKLSNATLFDEYNNYSDDLTVPDISFIITGGVSDIAAPVITDLAIDKNRNSLLPGDSLILSFKAEDESLLKEAEVYFIRSTDQSNQIYLYSLSSNNTLIFNSLTNKYEMLLTLPNDLRVGDWNLCLLRVFDNYNNYYEYSNLEFIWNDELHISVPTIILDLGFSIANGITDITAPVISNIDIDKNNQTLASGDSLKLTFKAEDESSIKDATVFFTNPLLNGYNTSFIAKVSDDTLIYNNTTSKYEIIFTIPDTMRIGEWNLSLLYVPDEYRNSSTFINEVTSYDRENDCYVVSYKQTLKFNVLKDTSKPIPNIVAGYIDSGTQVTLTTSTQGATIYYSTDGSIPSRDSNVYSSPIVVTNPVTIKAIAVKEGYADSKVMSESYTIKEKVAVPTANPTSGTITNGTEVSLTTSTTGATIYFTLDGTTPSTYSTVYTAPIKITSATTLKAFAVKLHMNDSAVLTAVYEIRTSTGGAPIDGGGGFSGGGGSATVEDDNKDKDEVDWKDISSKITEQLSNDQADSHNTNAPINLNIEMNKTDTLPQSIIQQIQGKNIELNIALDNGITWIINGNSISDSSLGDINLGVTMNSNAISENLVDGLANGNTNIQVSLEYTGSFGFNANIVFPIGKSYAGKTVSLFYYNPIKNSFDFMTANKADIEGNVTLAFIHASDYVIIIDDNNHIDKALLNDFSINLRKSTLYIGGTTGKTIGLSVNVPEVFRDNISNGLINYKVTFSSDMISVATVSTTGVITAKGIGNAIITTIITVGDVSTTYKTEIIVKKADIKFIKSKSSMKIGEKTSFTVKLYGYNASDVSWSTSKKIIINVGKNHGKLTVQVSAVSLGTDYLLIKVAGTDSSTIVKQLKITVK